MSNFDIAKFRREVLVEDPLVRDIHISKYRWNRPDGTSDEEDVDQTRLRVVKAVYANDPDNDAQLAAIDAVLNGYLIPAGRVNAGAGTGRRVTLGNCYVSATVMDSMVGIQVSIMQAAFTMQQGGGIGSDFSTIRPAGALVGRTGSVSSGMIPFADQQSAMCDTIMSAGTRRGAMMLTLRDDHPDLWNEQQFETAPHPATGDPILTHPSFISAKRQKGRLMGFNVSILVSDAFLDAVKNDKMWDLGFHVPRADGRHVDVYDKPFPYDAFELDNELKPIADLPRLCKGEMLPWYVYTRVKARRIYEDIMQSTYKYAEPGVIYIDGINYQNNLYYCEEIRCTNPCGEQPLPPNGMCDLASVNLAFMVRDSFSADPQFDWDLLARTAATGVRFLDNVLDVTNYPLEAQRIESMNKRRIGLGVTGFADALIQLGVRYGSNESVELARKMSRVLQVASYSASVELAKERGSFPLFDGDAFTKGWNVRHLPAHLIADIQAHGIRNGVLNTIAPNGTISIYTGNLASGHEPVFSFNPVTRKVRQPDGSALDYESVPYSVRLWEAMRQSDYNMDLPDYFVGAMDISVEDHVRVHAAWQEHIDASISKTINCPTDMDYDTFKGVYDLAYKLGCKGCTTYRYDPDSGRGSVLKEDDKPTLKNWDTEEVVPTPFSDEVIKAAAAEMFAGLHGISYDASYQSIQLPDAHHWRTVATNVLNEAGIALVAEATKAVTALMQRPTPNIVEVMPRPRILDGRTYKLKWPITGANWYIDITRDGNVPFEIFITTASAQHSEFVQALSRLLTAVFRRGGDVRFLVQELQAIHSATGGAFISEQHAYRPGIVAAIGGVLEEEFRTLGIMPVETPEPEATTKPKIVSVTVTYGRPGDPNCCPECGATPIVHEQGCERCVSCNWSRC